MDQYIFNKTTGYNVSNRYVAINTADIVSQFEAAGFTLNRASKAKVKDKAKDGFQKHLLVFRHPDAALGGVTGAVPEILLKNAYDGSSSFQLMLGVYRLVCANGLVVGTTYETMRVRHVGRDAVAQAVQGALDIIKQVETVAQSIRAMQATQLTDFQRFMFAKAAWGLIAPKTSVEVSIDSMLQPRRHADTGTDLWTVFNRIQENLIRGGVRYRTLNSDGNVRNATRRAVRAIDASLDINRELWTLAESFKVGA